MPTATAMSTNVISSDSSHIGAFRSNLIVFSFLPDVNLFTLVGFTLLGEASQPIQAAGFHLQAHPRLAAMLEIQAFEAPQSICR
jgi:hypothetical protein